MAKTAVTTGTSTITVVEQNTDIAVGDTKSTLKHEITRATSEASGTSASQNNLVWSDSNSTAGTVSLDLDALTSKLDTGTTLTFDKLTRVVVINKSTTTTENLQVGGNANAVPIFGAVADYIVIGPGGKLDIESPTDGWQVTASTGDILDITASTGTISYDVMLTGRTA